MPKISAIRRGGFERSGLSLAARPHEQFERLPKAALAPIIVVVFVGFLVVGLALPVLPLHVHDRLGLGTFVVGVVTGSQFAASLAARLWSGKMADAHGPKRAVVAGLLAAIVAGLIYVASLAVATRPVVSVAILIAGRAVLGAAESFIITGATAWGLARVGAPHAGRVIAWMGTAMFAALAVGGPLGMQLYAAGGFALVAITTSVLPLATLALIAPLTGAPPVRARRPSLLSIAGRVWLPGLAAACGSIGFGALLAFSTLLFAAHGWSPVWVAMTAYSVALIVARVFLGHLPDRFGGAKIALVSLIIESLGLLSVGLAPTAFVAVLGATLTGLGYALVFPGFGVEAVRRTPPESRGLAMGAYTGCLDLALFVAGPGLGLVAAQAGLAAVFLVSSAIGLCGIPVAWRLLRDRR